MLNNPIKREAVKGAGQVGLSLGGSIVAGPVGAVVSSALGVAVESLGHLSEKRSKELFDSKQLVADVVRKIQDSDDFASFVYSVWQRYCFESSKDRRRLLKSLLEHEISNSENEFDNFSKIEYLLQNASLKSLKLLKAFHSKPIYGRPINPDDARSRLTNIADIAKGIKEYGLNMHEQDLEYRINELCNYDLIAVSHGRFDGPFYNQTKLGFLLLEYIEELDD